MAIAVVFKPSNFAGRSTEAHEEHERSVKLVLEVLKGFPHEVIPTLSEAALQDYDLILTIGGDGTLLQAARHVATQPVLAVNSAPNHSIGYFCSCTASDLASVLTKWASGVIDSSYVTRMSVSVGSKVVTNRALNDVLYCHSNPSLTTRYKISSKGQPWEDQVSSGIWFSTAMGSTAAIRSAGGFTMEHTSANIQWKVREPYQPKGRQYNQAHGFIRPQQEIRIENRIKGYHVEGAKLYVDGGVIPRTPLLEGDTVVVKSSSEPLHLVNFRC